MNAHTRGSRCEISKGQRGPEAEDRQAGAPDQSETPSRPERLDRRTPHKRCRWSDSSAATLQARYVWTRRTPPVGLRAHRAASSAQSGSRAPVGVSAHRTYSADRIPKVVTVRRFAQHRPQLRQSDSLTEHSQGSLVLVLSRDRAVVLASHPSHDDNPAPRPCTRSPRRGVKAQPGRPQLLSLDVPR
jgi:hypothetical protein